VTVSPTRQALILAAAAICIVYRAFFTFNLTTPYAIIASSALFIAELYTGLLSLLFLLQVWRPSEPPELPVLPNRTVDVFVPTYHEDVQILRTTLRACVALNYPHRTYVLDDGRRPAVQALAEELGVRYIIRSEHNGSLQECWRSGGPVNSATAKVSCRGRMAWREPGLTSIP
jgi:cellulose synthase (UDP-forming)